jgi:hypothetical protein
MQVALTLLLFAAAAELPTEKAAIKPAQVFHCDFGVNADTNFDGWPDEWTRRRGRTHPSYLKIAIAEDPTAVGGRCLRVNKDGGAASVYSPPVPVSPKFSYVLTGRLKTVGLKNDEAYVTVTFYDASDEVIGEHGSEGYTDLPDWTEVTLGPVAPDNPDVRYAVIGLHVTPPTHRLADLRGAAMFDDVWMGRMPRMILETEKPSNVFTAPDEVEVCCRVSGILDPNPKMVLEVVDVGSGGSKTIEQRLAGKKNVDSAGAANTDDPDGYTGQLTWRPPLDDFGFYRLKATMTDRHGSTQQRTLSIAVLPPRESAARGEFGWSLPDGEDPLSLNEIADLLNNAGVNWVKFPAWYDSENERRADQLAWFIERLSRYRIQMVGVLDKPPVAVANQFGDAGAVDAASVFNEKELWHPILNPVMTRLSLKVHRWQLGSDSDDSWVGLPHLEHKITEIKNQLQRFGQEIHLGIGWRWLDDSPRASAPPWKFVTYRSDPPLTSEELTDYLEYHQASTIHQSGGSECWVQLTPLAKRDYSVDDRARDLVGRMLAAKTKHADAIIATNPFHPETGLMNPDGSPGELFVPWRTTALLVGGMDFLGRLNLPGGSSNLVFAKGDQAVLVVWNQHAKDEILYLGEHVQQVDLWGRSTTPEQQEHRHVIKVNSLPTFVVGVHRAIAECRMSFQFDRDRVPSVFDRPQSVKLTLVNHFGSGVGGTVTLATPDVWQVKPDSHSLRMAPDEELEDVFRLVLLPKASCGTQRIRADFEIAADRNYRFSVWRDLSIGMNDVIIELTAELDNDGNLIVQQDLINKTDDFVSFDCQLFAHGRRRLRQQVLDQPRGVSSKRYVLPNGKDLLGKTLWLRAMEIGGNRVLSYNITPSEGE